MQELRIRRDMAVRNQLDSQSIQAQLKMLIEGQQISSIIEQGRPVPLMIKGDPRLGNPVLPLQI